MSTSNEIVKHVFIQQPKGNRLSAMWLMTIFCLTVAACTWVKLSKDAEDVVVKSQQEISACKKVAKVTATLQNTVLGIERNSEKVKSELETLARNKAVEYKGNTVVPSSEIVSGMQDFEVYQCP